MNGGQGWGEAQGVARECAVPYASDSEGVIAGSRETGQAQHATVWPPVLSLHSLAADGKHGGIGEDDGWVGGCWFASGGPPKTPVSVRRQGDGVRVVVCADLPTDVNARSTLLQRACFALFLHKTLLRRTVALQETTYRAGTVIRRSPSPSSPVGCPPAGKRMRIDRDTLRGVLGDRRRGRKKY
nr:hypothetical protein CFP56_11203 [Quercus suber]